MFPHKWRWFWQTIFLIGLFSATANAALLEIQNAAVSQNAQEVRIPLKLTPNPDETISAVNFDVIFDNAILEYQGVDTGSSGSQAGKQVYAALHSSGVARVLILGVNQNTLQTGDIANLIFHLRPGLGYTQTSLSLSNATLTDPTGNTTYTTQLGSGILTIGFPPSETIYIYLNGKRVAQEDQDGKFFYYNDHLGSPVVIADQSNKEVRYLEYYSFGETKTEIWGNSSFADKDVKYKYNSKELDESTGLYDYGARQYDSILQRFISADPLDWQIEIEKDRNGFNAATDENFLTNPQNLNRYSYVRNNPLILTDSTGKKIERAQYQIYLTIKGFAIPTGRYHNYWILTPDNPSAFYGDKRFYKNGSGKLQTTVSGKPERQEFNNYGNLKSIPNSDRDEMPSSRAEAFAPKGKSDTQLIKDFLKVESSYKNDLPYDPLFPNDKPGSYNSNSLHSGVGQAVGLKDLPVLPGDGNKSPGLDKPIPMERKK